MCDSEGMDNAVETYGPGKVTVPVTPWRLSGAIQMTERLVRPWLRRKKHNSRAGHRELAYKRMRKNVPNDQNVYYAYRDYDGRFSLCFEP